MTDIPKINVILATYNESDIIVPCINLIRSVLDDMKTKYKIILVDDNSPDGTAKIVKYFDDKRIVIIERPRKMGLGSAYISAIPHCKYDHTIILDSDLQHSPADITTMINYIVLLKSQNKKVDVVVGTRFSGRNIEGRFVRGKVCNWTFYRKFQSTLANNLAKYVLDLKVTDLTSSFRVYRTDVLKELIEQVSCHSFGFQVEIIARAEKRNYNIVEIPITFYDRRTGSSKLGLMEICRFFVMLIILYFKI